MARPADITENQLLDLHHRVLADDPTAPAKLAEMVFDALADEVARSPAGRRWPDLVRDAVSDAFMSYLKQPSQFNPAKRWLWGFLVMAAKGDLSNAIEKERRRKRKEKATSHVADVDLRRNKLMGSNATKAAAKGADFLAIVRESRKLVERAFPDRQDRDVIELMLNRVSEMGQYVDVLGIAAMPTTEQQKTVKRVKDRLTKRLRRLAEEQYGES